MIILIGCCLLGVAIALTGLNILYLRNIRSYVGLIKRGMVRVSVNIKTANGSQVVKGWVYKVDLGSTLSNPVSQSSAFIKVYERGMREVVIAFSTVEKLQVLNDNFLAVIVARKVFI